MIDADALLDAMSAAVDLPVAPEHRDGVKAFLAIAAGMAAIVDAVPLNERELQNLPSYLPPESEA